MYSESNNVEEVKITAAYYGKKTYRLHPFVVRVKKSETIIIDYRSESIDEKES